jgi:hypothetical protein
MKRLIRFVLLTFGYLIAVGRVLRQRLVNHRFGVVSFGLFALAGLVGILMPPTQASAATPTAGLQTYIFHNSSNNDSSYYWGDKSNLNTWFEDRGYGSANMTMITTDIGNTWSASQYYTNNTNSPKSYNAGDTSSLDYYSALFLGYIKPDVNIQHLYLQISSDDSSALFFGAGAANGATFSMANAAVNNNYIQGNTARSSGDLGSVTAGKYYPIRAEFGEWAGGDVVNIRYSSDGVNWNALPTTWIYNQGSTVTNDQTAPAAPAAPTLTAATDSGASSVDGITSNASPVLQGTTEGNATVSVYSNSTNSNSGGTLVGTGTASGTGAYTYTLSISSSTDLYYYVTAADQFGNTSAASPTFRVRANKINISTGAAGAQSGFALATQPVVALTDGGSATVTATNSMATLANAAVSASAGTATFTSITPTYTSGSIAGSTMTYSATGYFSAIETLSAIPAAVTVSTGSSTAGGSWINNTFYTTSTGTVNITPADLAAQINSASSNLYAFGNISINNPVTATTASRALKIASNASIGISGTITTNNGAVTVLANADAGTGANGGNIGVYANIVTQGAPIILAGGDWNDTTGYARGLNGSTVADNAGIYVSGTINSGGGAITMRGALGIATTDSAGMYVTSGGNITAAGGNIIMNGLIESNSSATGGSFRALRIGGGSSTPFPTVTTTGTGTIALTGKTSKASALEQAVLLENGTVSAVNGDVSITADANSGASAALVAVTGDTTVSTSGAGNISINSTTATSGGENLTNLIVNSGGNLTFTAPTFTLPKAWTSAGNMALTAGSGDMTLNANLSVTGASKTLTLKSTGNIIQGASTVSTNGGAALYWSDTDAATARGGGIKLASTSSVTTGGGALTLSGGTDYTTSWAKGTTNTGEAGVWLAGTITSGAGNIVIRGEEAASPSTTREGVLFDVASVTTTTTGTITVNGRVDSTSTDTGNNHYGVYIGNGQASSLAYISTGSGDISILGDSTNNSGVKRRGIIMYKSAVSSSSGAITLDGRAGANTDCYDLWFYTGNNSVISTSGAVTIKGSAGSNTALETATISSGASVTLQLSKPSVSTGSTVTLGGAGDKVIEPPAAATDFAAALSTTGFSFGTTSKSIRIGKATVTQSLTVSSAIAAAGPISLLANSVSFAKTAGLDTTALVGSAILVKSKMWIQADSQDSAAAATKFVTDNGDITFWTVSGGGSDGSVTLGNYTVLDSTNGRRANQATGGGRITIAGGTATTNGYPTGPTMGGTNNSYGICIYNYVRLYSGGGDQYLYGKSPSGNYFGYRSGGDFISDSGQGQITVRGDNTSSAEWAATIGEDNVGDTVFLSEKTTGTAIDISANASSYAALSLNRGGTTANLFVVANGGGAINLTGNGSGSWVGLALDRTQVLSTSGKITLDGGPSWLGVGYLSRGEVYLGAKSGSSYVTSSTADILLKATTNIDSDNTTTMAASTAGDVTVQATGANYTSASNWGLTTACKNFTFGKSTETQDLTLSGAVTAAGTISVYGQSLILNGNLSTSTASQILLKARGNITLAASKSLTSTGGPIVIWGRAGSLESSADLGYFSMDNGSSLSSGGGAIYIAGSTLVDTNGFPLGHLYSNDTTNKYAITIGTSSGGASSSISSGGGAIRMYAQTGNSASQAFAVQSGTASTIDSGTGRIDVNALSSNTNDNVFEAWNGGITVTSNAPADAVNNVPAIKWVSNQTNSSSTYNPIQTAGLNNLTWQATGGGDIDFTATSANTTVYAFDVTKSIQFLASSGQIRTNFGVNGLDLSGSTAGSVTYGATSGGTSSSQVVITGDRFNEVTANAASAAAVVRTSGTATIQPSAQSFSSTQTFDSTWGFFGVNSGNIGGLVIGQSGTSSTISGATQNASDVTFSAGVTAGGPIAIYGKTVTAGASMTTTGSASGAIVLKASQDVLISNGANTTTRNTLTTANSPITLWSNADASGSGAVQLGDFTKLNSTGGAITLAGGGSATEASPSGAATGYSNNIRGVTIGVNQAAGNVDILSAGGNIVINGYTAANITWANGVTITNGTNINSGTGTIAITGNTSGAGSATSSMGVEVSGGGAVSTTTITSANTSPSAIVINANSQSSAGANAWGFSSANNSGTNLTTISATGAGGGVQINATTAASSTTSSMVLTHVNVLAKGAVVLDGGTKNIQLTSGASADGNTVGGANSGDCTGGITLRADSITFATATTTLRCTAPLVIEPSSNAFAGNQTWSTSLVNVADITNFRWGKTTNTANMTVSSPISVSGNVEVYGAALTNSSQVQTTGGTITYAGSTFSNTAALSTDGRDISVTADQMTIGAALTANKTSAGIVSLIPKTSSKNIDLGAADSSTLLGLTNTELGYVTAKVLRIGSAASTNNINLSANVSVASSSVPNLALRGAGSVTNSGSFNISALNLAISVGGAISLGGANSVSGNLALVAGGASGGSGVAFGGTTTYAAASVDTIDAVYGVGKNISISSAPAIGSTEVRYLNQTWSAPPVITVTDAYGYTISTYNSKASTYSTTIAGSGSPTITGATPTVSGGTQTFSSLKFTTTPGTTALTFTTAGLASGGTSSVTTGTYNVQAGDPATIAIATTSTSAQAGKAGFGITATLKDAGGNTISGPHATDSVTVSVSDGDSDPTNNAAIIAGGSPSTVAGVADFTGLKLSGKVSVNYTITFSVTYTDSNSVLQTKTATQVVTLTPGDATKLAVTRQAAGFINRADFTTQPIVAIQDTYGNTVTSSSASVAVVISAVGATSTQSLTGSTAATASSGLATFNGLGKYGATGNKRLTFSSNGLSSDTQDFTLTFGAANKLAFTTPATTVNDTVFGTQPTVTVQDQDGNPVGDFNSSVTLSSTNATIGGTVAMNATSGFADFAGKGVKLTGTVGAKNITATIAGGITQPNSVSITYGAAYQLAITQQAAGAVNGVAFTTQPKVTVKDISGNTVDSATDSITVTSSGATLATATTVNAIAGTAIFAGLKLTGTAATYTLTFSSGSLASAPQTIALGFGAADHLAISTAAANAVNGSAFGVLPVITIQDQSNNTVTNLTSAVTVSSSGSSLSGTSLLVNAVGGIATFSSNALKLTGAAGTYTLTYAISSPSALSVTQPITVTPGAATKLALTTPAAGFVNRTDFTTAPAVSIEDASGNVVTTANANITVSIDSGTLTGATTVAASSGVATFTGLGKNGTIGAKNLTFHSGSLTDAAQTFTLTYGSAYQLAKTVPAAGFTNAVAFTTQPKITIQDQDGNTVANATTNVIIKASGGALSGTVSMATVAGVADFSGMAVTLTGAVGDYTLTYLSLGSLSTSQTITLGYGVADHLTLTTQAAGAVDRVTFTTQPIVEVRDVSENVVLGNTAIVTATSSTGATIGGSSTRAAASGVADFDLNATKTQLYGTVGSYTVTYSAPGITSATQSLDLHFGVATKLAMTSPATLVNDTAFGTQPVVTIQDQDGNTVTDSTATVTLTTTGASISGTTSMAATAGVADFAGQNVKLTGVIGSRSLTASSGSLTSATNQVTLTFGAATQLALTTQAAGFVNRVNFTTVPVVTLQDVSGNTVTDSNLAIDASIDSGTLTGITHVVASNGVATFTGLGKYGQIGTKVLTFADASGNLPSITQSFTLTHGAATRIALAVSRTLVNATEFATQPVVTIYDQDSNVVTTGSQSSQNVRLTAQPATAGGTVSMGGTVTMSAVNGVADFAGKGISLTGTIGDKRVSATLTAIGLNSGVIVNVTPGAADHLTITTAANNAANGAVFGTQPVVEVRDVSQNRVTDSTLQVGASISDGTLTGSTQINAVGGIATFTNLGLTASAGTKTLTFAATNLTSATQSILAVTGAPSQLRIDVASSLVNDTVFGTQPVVTLLDSTGTVVSAGANSTQTVTLSSPDATIGGTVSMAAVGGVADFTGKAIKLTGLVGNRSLVASISQPNSVTQTATINLTFGAANHLHIASGASGAADRIAFTNQPAIEVLDVSGNRITNSTAAIAVSAAGANGAVIGGDTSMNASSGIAYFAQNANGLKLTGTIGTYHLTYSSGALSTDGEDIALTHGTATKLVVSQSASGAKSGQAFSVQPKVQVQDADGNLVTTGAASSASIQVTVSSDAYDSGAHTGVNLTGASGFDTVSAVAGEASFAGARLEGVVSSAYVLKFAIVATPGYNGLLTSQNLALTAGTQTHISVVQQPTAIIAGAAFSPAVSVEILDAWNNRVLDAPSTVTVKPSLVDDALGTNVLDSSKTAVSNTAGLVAFTGLTFTEAGSQYVQFTSAGLLSAISTSFTITNAQAHHLVWVTSPVGAKNDYAIKGAANANPELEIRDQYENPVLTGPATSVDVTEASASGNVISISGGSARNSVGSARIVFSALVLRAKVGGYTLRFSATNGSLPINGTHVDSLAPVSISFGDPAALHLTRAAAGANSGSAFATQPKLNIEDTAGNVVGDSSLNVTVSSTATQALSGTRVKALVGGSVDFTDSGLTFTGAVATGLPLKYAVTYNSTEISTNQTIDLNPGLAVALTIGQQPTTTKTRVSFNPVPTVVLRDSAGNQVTTDSASSVTAQLKDSSGNPVGSETSPFTASNGLVTFTGLAFQAPSTTNYYVTFKLTSNGQAVTSNAFDILPGVATELRITRQPSTLTLDSTPGKTGELLSVQPIAKLYDQDGNLVTNANSGVVTVRVHSTDSAGDLSEGSVTANIVGGVANFAGVKFVGTPGVAYNLDFATATPNPALTSAASSAISVTHNDATHLVITRAAANGRSGMLFSTQPIIRVKDRYENTVTSGPDSTADITATGDITAPTIGVTNPSNDTATAVDGVATFQALGLTGLVSNTYRLNFNIVGSNTVAGVSQSNVTISYGSANHLTLVTQPLGGNATGQNLATQPVVEVRDGVGNKVANSTLTVTASIISTSGLTLLDGSSARLTGTSKAAVAGVASFDALDLYGLPGVGYTLKFAVNGLGYAASNAIQVTHAVANHLFITTQPTGGNATGANLAGQPVVQLRDVYENLVSADSTDVLTAQLSTASATERLAGSSTATFANGVASFSGLQVIALPETNYSLSFTSTIGGNTITSVASSVFQVTYASATKLAVYQQTVAGTTGTQLTTQPIVEVQDFYGNRVRNFSGTVTASVGGSGVSLTNSTYAGGGNPLDQTVVDGRATFSGLELTGIPATDYQLTFASTTLTSVNSGNIRVTPGAPVRIEIVNQPIGSQTGAALAGQPVVKIVDSFGNTVTQNSSTVISAAITSGTGGTLTRVVASNSVPLSATTVNGVATFSNLYMRGLTNHNYQLTFSSGDLAPAVSADFQVSHAAVSQLVWNTQPTVGMTGSPVTRAAVLELQDLDGNIATSDSSTVVTAVVTSGAGSSPLQNATATADHGVVTFSNLTLTGVPGTAYKLTFTAVVGSTSFSAPATDDLVLAHAVPAKLTMRGGNVTGGLTGENLTSQPTLNVRDRFNNIATSDNSTVVTASIYNDTTGSVSGSVIAQAVNGAVTFAGLKVSGVPGTAYTLRFTGDWTGTTLTAVNSNTFTVSKQASVNLAYTAQQYVPSGVVHPAFSTDSPGAVTYSTTSPSTICSLNTANGEITINGVGTCAVHVDVAATTYYLANYAEASLVISKANQAPVTITSPGDVNYWATLTPSASGGTGTGAIFFSVNGSCRIVGTTLLPGDAGSLCQLSATRMGDANYLAAVPDFQTIAIHKLAQQTLSIANASDMIVGSLDLFTAGGSGSGAVSFAVNSADAARCSISGATLTATASGDCRISAVKAASTNYDASNSATQTIHVSKDVQNVIFTSTAPTFPVAQGSYTPTAAATSALAVTFAIVTSNSAPACAFDSTDSRKVNFLTSGDCEIVATQAGNGRYQSATASQKITVGVLNQTIAFATLADKTFGTPAFQLSANSNSGLPVSIATTSGSTACSISNLGIVTLNSSGLCELQATQAGNNTYAAATPVIRSFTVTADLAGAPHIYSSSATTHAFTVAFTAPSYTGGSSITAYALTVTDANGNVFENAACPAGTATINCTIVGISNDVAYTAVVRAITIAGKGAASNVSMPQTPLDAPVAVTNLSASTSSNDLVVTWSPPTALDSSFTRYEVYAAPIGSPLPTAPSATVSNQSATGVTLSNIVPSVSAPSASPSPTTGSASIRIRRASVISNPAPSSSPSSQPTAPSGYQVSVVTITQSSTVPSSTNTSNGIQTSFSSPLAPSRLTLDPVGTKLLISWTPPTADGGSAVTGYDVSVNGSSVCTATAALACEFDGMAAGRTYTVSVIAKNAIGSGVAASDSYSTPAPPAIAGVGANLADSHGMAILSGSVKTVSTKGGALLTLHARNFNGITLATIDGQPLKIVSNAEDEVTLELPEHAAGPVDITFKSRIGTLIYQDAVTYVAPPRAPMTQQFSRFGSTSVATNARMIESIRSVVLAKDKPKAMVCVALVPQKYSATTVKLARERAANVCAVGAKLDGNLVIRPTTQLTNLVGPAARAVLVTFSY